MLERADHDGVDVARQHARGVGQRLAAAELHFLAGEHDHVAAQVMHGDVERDPRAGRRLVEDHRQRPPRKRPAHGEPRAARLFQRARQIDHAPQIARLQLGKIEEMADAVRAGAGAGHSAAPRRACATSPASSFVQAADSRFMASPTSASPTMSGGTSRTTFSPAATTSKFSVAAGGDEIRIGHQHADAQEQSLAAHLGDQRRMPVADFREPLLEQEPGLVHALEEALLQHHVEHRIGHRHRQRIAAEGRAVRARGHALGRRFGGQTRADRKAAADALGDRHDVGLDARPLIGEQLADAADAGLHLVEDQHQLVLVGELAQAAQKTALRHPHAAFALDRLDDDRAGLRPDGFLHGVEIAERHPVEARQPRLEAFEIFFVAAGRDRRQRAAVEGALERDHAELFRPAGGELVTARHLDRALHRLGARIGEEDGVGESRLDEPLGQPLAAGDAKQVGDVPDLLRLLGERLDQLGVRVAERVHRHAGGEIEVALAVLGDQPGALAPLEHEVGPRIDGQNGRNHGRLQGDQEYSGDGAPKRIVPPRGGAAPVGKLLYPLRLSTDRASANSWLRGHTARDKAAPITQGLLRASHRML